MRRWLIERWCAAFGHDTRWAQDGSARVKGCMRCRRIIKRFEVSPWTAPRVWATGDVLPAGDLNTYLSENLDHLGGVVREDV